MTADIKAVTAGSTVTKKQTVGNVEMTVTHTAPVVKIVDETVQEPVSYSGKLPVDTGKVATEILPGMSLVRYSRGYTALRVKGKSWGGNKVTIGRPLYRDDLLALGRALLADAEGARSYDEAHGEEVVPF